MDTIPPCFPNRSTICCSLIWAGMFLMNKLLSKFFARDCPIGACLPWLPTSFSLLEMCWETRRKVPSACLVLLRAWRAFAALAGSLKLTNPLWELASPYLIAAETISPWAPKISASLGSVIPWGMLDTKRLENLFWTCPSPPLDPFSWCLKISKFFPWRVNLVLSCSSRTLVASAGFSNWMYPKPRLLPS